MLRCESLKKKYGSSLVLNDVNLALPVGGVSAIIGRNGSGKSTLLKCITGWQKVNSGTVSYNGQDLTRFSVVKRAKFGIMYGFQEPAITQSLTAMDLFDIARLLSGTNFSMDAPSEILNHIDRSLFTRPVSHLSFGQRKIVNLAVLLSTNAKTLLLDEPVAGLSVELIEAVGRCLSRYCTDGKTVCLVEHDFDFISSYCGTTFLLNEGKILKYGASEAVLSSDELVVSFT